MKEILSKKGVEHFIQKGYVRIDEAFPKQMVDEVLVIQHLKVIGRS